VRALLAPFIAVHHGLEQRSEDRRADLAPIEFGGGDQIVAHLRIEYRCAEMPGEQLPVHVRKFGEFRVHARHPLVGRRVQHLEQLVQHASDVSAVLVGALLDQIEEIVLVLENAGVVSEQAEQQPYHQPFEIYAAIVPRLKRIVDRAEQFGGLDVDRSLRAVMPTLHAEHESKFLDMLVQFGKREGYFAPRFQFLQAETLKIADQHELRQVTILEPQHIIMRLPFGLQQILARAFLFNQQHTRPEKINETALVALDQLDLLFEHRDTLAINAEDIEKFVIEALGFTLFIMRLLPALRKTARATANFLPA